MVYDIELLVGVVLLDFCNFWESVDIGSGSSGDLFIVPTVRSVNIAL